MLENLLVELRSYVGFAAKDAERLRTWKPHVAPHLPEVARRFYEEVRRHPRALAVFTRGETQIAHQQKVLTAWLEDLFEGPYDEAFYARRLDIGRVHVAVNLPQHFMFSAMEVIRQELSRVIRETGRVGIDGVLESLGKLLTIDLAVMMESFKDAYAQNIRESERSAVEEKLTRAEHLAEIGQLAASLAHEIKNPLAGISGAIQIIGDTMPEADPHKPIIGEILGQIGRLDAAVKDLLVYARPTPPRQMEFDLDKIIRRVLTILHEEPALQRVRMKYTRTGNLPPGRGDEAQIEQLLMNLIINAADASPHNGSIKIYTTSDDEEVTFAVQDSGHGMTPEVRARAFEPFFTTKAKGTGLGLSICRRIIDAHNGKVSVDSNVGEGTTVIVSLPRAFSETT